MRHVGVAALLLLITGASALPKKPPGDTKKICGLGADSDKERKETWSKTGGPFLDNYFKKNDIKDWSNQFFIQNVNHGDQAISTHDCKSIDSDTCGPADHCDDYKTPEAFFVHQSMATLHNQLNYLSSNIGRLVTSALGKTADELADDFGPPDPDSKDFLSYMIGGAITGAAAAGPAWAAASPLVGIAGFLNIINGVLADDKSLTPEQLSGDLKHHLTDVFNKWNGTLGDGCSAIFGGDAKILSDNVDNPEQWIKDLFSNGKYLNGDWADKQTKVMWADIKKRINQGLVIMALKGGKYYVSRRTDLDKKLCEKPGGSNYVWAGELCSAIGKDDKQQVPCDGGSCEGWKLTTLNDDQLKKFTKTYGFDYKEAILNAMECAHDGGGSRPIQDKLPPFGKMPDMPKCYFNLDVKYQDYDGRNDGSSDPGLVGPDGYTHGQCGVHVQQKKLKNGDVGYELQATLKDDQQMKIATGKFQPARPTVSIKGKESDEKEGVLPYDFHMAIEDKDGKEIKFWYSDQYWTTNDKNSEKKFPGCGAPTKYGKKGIRSFDCGFTCKAPSKDPPPSATKDHPLPTSLSYAKGWCTFHIKLTKMGGESYNVGATVYDADRKKIGGLDGSLDSNVGYDKTIAIEGQLPQKLAITPSPKTVKFSYDGKNWKVNSDAGKRGRGKGGHECRFGGWENPVMGHDYRQLDCGFFC